MNRAVHERPHPEELHYYQGALNALHSLFHTLVPLLAGEFKDEELHPMYDLFPHLQVLAELENHAEIELLLVKYQAIPLRAVQLTKNMAGINLVARSFHDLYFTVSKQLLERFREKCYTLRHLHDETMPRIAMPPAYIPLDPPPPYKETAEPLEEQWRVRRSNNLDGWNNVPYSFSSDSEDERDQSVPIRYFTQGVEREEEEDEPLWTIHTGPPSPEQPPLDIEEARNGFEEYVRMLTDLPDAVSAYLEDQISGIPRAMESTGDAADHISAFRHEVVSQLGGCPLCRMRIFHCDCDQCTCQDQLCFWRWSIDQYAAYVRRAPNDEPSDLHAFVVWFVLQRRYNATPLQRAAVRTYQHMVRRYGSIFWGEHEAVVM